MLQSDRNWLFNLAYGLDSHERVVIPKKQLQFPKVDGDDLDKLRIQEKTDKLYVLLSEQEAAELAERLREIAANDDGFRNR